MADDVRWGAATRPPYAFKDPSRRIYAVATRA